MSLFVLILSIVITLLVCRIINRNTFGTLGAYIKRAIVVWVVVFLILAGIVG